MSDMNRQIPPRWNSEKIASEYSKRKSRLTQYRICAVFSFVCAILGYGLESKGIVGLSVFMFVFSFLMERHTASIMDTLRDHLS